jgi:hypothetical protein
MTNRWLGLTATKDSVVAVDATIPDNGDDPIVIMSDDTWRVQKGDRAAAYHVLHQQCADYIKENGIDTVIVKASAVAGKGSATLGILLSAEVRGVVIAAAASQCQVKALSKALVSRTYGDRKVDEYVELRFSPEAQAIRDRVQASRLWLQEAFEEVSDYLASQIGKYDSIFGSLCILFHCIEHAGQAPGNVPTTVEARTAQMAHDLLFSYILPHSVAFFLDVLDTTKGGAGMKAVADMILARGKTQIVHRDLAHGTRETKALKPHESRVVFDRLVAFGWLMELPLLARIPSPTP